MITYLSNLIEKSHQNLLEDMDSTFFSGYAYLRGRGVTDEQIHFYKLGLGLNIVKCNIKSSEGVKFNKQFYGTMKGQVIIPLYNSLGKLRGIETRYIESTHTRKYTQYFLSNWKEDAVFLGLPYSLKNIWDTQTVYLVEGMFDFFPVQRVFPNTLCTLSARVMYTQYRFLCRYCKHVVFLFDRDDKGISVVDDQLDRYNIDQSKGYHVHRISFPTKDIGEFYEKRGYEYFRSYLIQQSSRLNLYL